MIMVLTFQNANEPDSVHPIFSDSAPFRFSINGLESFLIFCSGECIQGSGLRIAREYHFMDLTNEHQLLL